MADSPYPLRVLPGRPCPRICEVVGEGRSRAVAGRPAAFEIRIYDEFGNRRVEQKGGGTLLLSTQSYKCREGCHAPMLPSGSTLSLGWWLQNAQRVAPSYCLSRWFGDGLEQLLPLEVTLECGGQECPISVEARREGQQCSYACTYKALAPGFYRLHVTHGGAPLPRTPFSVQVSRPGEAPRASCWCSSLRMPKAYLGSGE